MTGTYKNAGKAMPEVYDVLALGKGLTLANTSRGKFTKKRATDLLEKTEEFLGDRKLKQTHVDSLVIWRSNHGEKCDLVFRRHLQRP